MLVGILAGTDTLLLEERVNLSAEETALFVNLDLDDGGVSGDTCETHAVRCAEIPKAISDETTLIDLGGSYDMGTVTIDDVGTVVDTEMGELTETAAVLTQKALGTLWQVTLGTSLGTSMEGDDDNVRLPLQVVDDALDGLEVTVLEGILVMSEGAQSELDTVADDNGGLYTSLDA